MSCTMPSHTAYDSGSVTGTSVQTADADTSVLFSSSQSSSAVSVSTSHTSNSESTRPTSQCHIGCNISNSSIDDDDHSGSGSVHTGSHNSINDDSHPGDDTDYFSDDVSAPNVNHSFSSFSEDFAPCSLSFESNFTTTNSATSNSAISDGSENDIPHNLTTLSQLSIAPPPVYHAQHATNLSSPPAYPINKTLPKHQRRHRISLLSTHPSLQQSPPHILLSKLKSHPLQSEALAVKTEIQKLDSELNSLHYELRHMEKLLQYQYAQSLTPPWGALPTSKKLRAKHRLERGLHFQVQFSNERRIPQPSPSKYDVKQSFQSRCGGMTRAKTLRHVTLLGKSSFAIFRDSSKCYLHGTLPPNFQKRMIAHAKSSPHSRLRYLSFGPRNKTTYEACYYAEWNTGECWWVNFDIEFHNVVSRYDVHRVAFGPFPSWIVLTKSGYCAWRGIPTPLHNALKGRKKELPAACEVSLGPGEAFFVRFLDGETDYVLPAIVANKCEEVEKGGGVVKDVSLHVDCQDFIIRHTAMGRRRRKDRKRR